MDWKTLLWWLGPWCNQELAPAEIGFQDTTVCTAERAFRFRLYTGAVRNGAVLVLPGLHPDGLDDARIDRFCRVLAEAGAVVGVPELPTMMESVMVPSLLDDVERAGTFFAQLLSQNGVETFGVFCISASSIGGLHLATHQDWAHKISRMHLFGGFSDWMEALRFAMTGTVPHVKRPEQRTVDPLSLPVVYMNLMSSFPSFLPLSPEIQSQLLQRLHDYVGQSWEKPEVVHPIHTKTIAERLFAEWQQASQSDVDWTIVRSIFFQACALESGGQDVVLSFLDKLKMDGELANVEWLNVEARCSKLTVPLDISHGRDDFVVPHTQAQFLKRLSPPKLTRVFVTGLYHHTGVVSVSRLFRLLVGLPKEIWTSIQMVRALSDLTKR